MSKKPEIYICTNLRLSGGSCSSQGAFEVLKALRAEAAVKQGDVVVHESVCMGYCGQGPNLKVMGGDFHHGVTPAEVPRLIAEAVASGARKAPSDA